MYNSNMDLAFHMCELAKEMINMCSMMSMNQNNLSRNNNGFRQANSMNNFSQRPDPSYNSYNPVWENYNSYNPGWENHPNCYWGNNQNIFPPIDPPQPKKESLEETLQKFMQGCTYQGNNNQNYYQPNPPQPEKPSFEDTLQNYIQANEQRFRQREASLDKLDIQVRQIVKALQGRVPGKLPSQLEEAKAMTALKSEEIIKNNVNENITPKQTEIIEKLNNDADVSIDKDEPQLHKFDDPYMPPKPYVPPIPTVDYSVLKSMNLSDKTYQCFAVKGLDFAQEDKLEFNKLQKENLLNGIDHKVVSSCYSQTTGPNENCTEEKLNHGGFSFPSLLPSHNIGDNVENKCGEGSWPKNHKILKNFKIFNFLMYIFMNIFILKF